MTVTWKKVAFEGDAPTVHESTHVSGGSDDIDSALAIAAMAGLASTKIWQGNVSNRPAEVDLPVGGYTEGAKVYRTANQTIPDATWTKIAFTAERYDTDTIHDNATNNSQLVCKTAGKYLIIGHLRFADNTVGNRQFVIYLNNTTDIAHVLMGMASPATAGLWEISCPVVYELAVNNYVEIMVFQTSGGNLDVRAIGDHTPEFEMQRIG